MQNSKKKFRLPLFLALVAVLAFTALTIGAAPQSGASDGIGGQVSKAPANRSYVVLMELDPAAVYEGDIEGLPATKGTAGEKFNAQSAAADDYAAYSLNRQDAVLNAAGVAQSMVTNRYTTVLNGFSAIMSPDQAAAVARQPGVTMVMKDGWLQPMTDSTPGFLGLDGAGDAWDTGYDGEGVVVGVIDSGIWPEHPSFADDGSYADPGLVLEDTTENPACNFGNTAYNPNDAPFTCNNKLVGARQFMATYRAVLGAEPGEYESARDDDGHGTHTASTAAGNSNVMASMYAIDRGLVSGIAPRAYVLAYKSCGPLGCFTSDTSAAIDQAVADGVDVINFSIGGGASLSGFNDIAFLFAADAGVHVATSAGNGGPGPGTIGGPASVPWLTSVGANTQNRFFKGDIILGDGRTITGASITPGISEMPLADGLAAGSELCLAGQLDPNLVSGKIVLCQGPFGRAAKSHAVLNAGGVGMILYNDNDEQTLPTDLHWVPTVHIDNTPGMEIRAYIAGQPYAYNTYVPVFAGGNGEVVAGSTSGGPATAQIVGLGVTDLNYSPAMAFFSSRGPDPVAEDIIKPDITAPGVQILAGNSPTPIGLYPGELFQSIQGTSMSSPHIAGIFALMDQAHPDWSPAAVKSAIMTTADQAVLDNDRVTPAGPFAMGAGHVNPQHASLEGSPFQPGLVYDAGFNDYLGFLCDEAPEVFVDAAATCAALEGIGVPIVARDLNLASIGIAELSGTATITREVTSVASGDPIEYMVSVDAPEGYSVSVNPESFTLADGESQTFEVTFTNNSAPIGEWSFGSLSWTSADGKYVAYSPIAVKATLIGVPGEVDGEGADGSGSFEVSFGYTGSYEAAGHGLEPATVTEDNVVQDPDQNFDPNDGYSNAYTFDLQGAAYFRVIIPPDGVDNPDDVDLDMYLFDPTGELVASSTNGGTDEQIDVVLPMDGAWTLFVHGWQTAGPSADYTMYDWIISATPGGSLSIDSAPDEAVLATVGMVDYSWTGAADAWFLGAVSHAGAEGADDPGLLGLTLVNVDNRP